MTTSAASTSSAVAWSSSGAGGQVLGTPRHQRVLELHRLHFVQNKGHSAVNQTIEARCQEGKKADAKAAKEHTAKLQELSDKMTDKVKNALAHGSMSIRTKEETDKLEEARRDPQEAIDRMAKEMKQRQRTYKEHQQTMKERVAVVPPMNLRKKAEMEAIEAARQDPEEAKERTQALIKQRKEAFKKERKEMNERLKAIPPTTTRSKEERARIEELRQDPDEASKAMEKHLKSLAKSYKEEQAAMAERVWSRPDDTQWSKEQRAEIEERRQDPEEAKQKVKQHMKRLNKNHKAHQEDLAARVRARPPLNVRSKEERAAIEEARQDPNEALQSARAHMKELARSYQDHKRQIHERIHSNGLVSFRSPRAQEVVAQKILKNNPLK